MNNILNYYNSLDDYLHDIIFECETIMDENDKLYSLPLKIKKKKFLQNKYPYYLPLKTNHYILWYSYVPDNDEIINKDIYSSLFKLLNNNKFNFVWYYNPKPTIHNIYHVQVFWIKI